MRNIAVDSDGATWSSGHLNGLRNRHAKIRARLQGNGTKSAKRLLRRRSGRERRFATAVNRRLQEDRLEG